MISSNVVAADTAVSLLYSAVIFVNSLASTVIVAFAVVPLWFASPAYVAVISTVPAEIPVITPASLTVATAVLLLV